MKALRLLSFLAAVLWAGGASAASMYVAEFPNGLSIVGSTQPQIVPQPAITTQKVSISGSSTSSSAFNAQTRAIEVMCSAGCSIALGTSPTATTSTQLLQQGVPYVFGVTSGMKIAVIANSDGDVPGGGSGGGALLVGGYEFNTAVVPTVQNAAYAAGQSLGGLQTISIGSTDSLTGILTQIRVASKGGSVVGMVAYVWDKNPSSTTCTDKTNFVVSQTDNQHLIGSPTLLTPALVVSAQDTTTYAQAGNLTYNFVNSSTNTNLYVCLLANASVTPATTTDLRINIQGIKNQP